MDLVATSSLKSEINILTKLDENVVTEFARTSLDILRKGTLNTKGFASAGKKLGVTAEDIQQSCLALCHILLETGRSEPDVAAFGEYLHDLGFRADARQALIQFSTINGLELRAMAVQTTSLSHLAHYKQLEWRLDVQMASRSMRREATPSYLLKLTTETPDGTQASQVMQADLATMRHWSRQVDAALAEATSASTRRLMRHVHGSKQ
mmetsp:Transcript_41225/g.68984  ORF Transcript_41225/g.68984 Transcript_41225/m.68984 type:complete len:208 (-) Transcript_41225:232-855(-)|eukprot:CAMPEP_0198203418 /NCGR_PEP_ID=MMETSP1445-20131203/6714_1 /TAXON_ID=36898 /ORGANISM="Pyramimonas sp., Strain CCMP2087" /LENGTH=207 /DNA_ID=CAMNT_0043874811 /DNA_START=416 /DNA_END=1039 /DNA_ORIENTATION=+